MRIAGAILTLAFVLPVFAEDRCQIWGKRKCGVLVEQALAVVRASPQYPEYAKKLRQEGVIYVHVDIDDRGEVVFVAPTGGPMMFRAAAMQAARQWRFRPARINHRSVPSSTVLIFRFTLSGES